MTHIRIRHAILVRNGHDPPEARDMKKAILLALSIAAPALFVASLVGLITPFVLRSDEPPWESLSPQAGCNHPPHYEIQFASGTVSTSKVYPFACSMPFLRTWDYGLIECGRETEVISGYVIGKITIRFTALLPVFALACIPALALVRNKSEHRNRLRRGQCIGCGYDLSGNVRGACPECGSAHQH